MADPILLEKKENIGIITINRPEVHNAFNEAAISALDDKLEEIETDDAVKVIVLTGAGSETFCAGGDLKYFATLQTEADVRAMSERMQGILNRLWNGNIPVIAAVNGQALGGGCEIVTACHIRIASSSASFAFKHVSIGAFTGWGGGTRLIRQLGRRQALSLLLTAKTIHTDRAFQLGLIDNIVPPNQLMDTVIKLAQKIGGYAKESIEGFLQLARSVEKMKSDDAIKVETDLFCRRFASKEFREILKGFID